MCNTHKSRSVCSDAFCIKEKIHMMNVIENHNFSEITWHFDGNFMGIYPVFRHAVLKQIV